MSDSFDPPVGVASDVSSKTPLDLKLFYAFVTALTAASVVSLVFCRRGNNSQPQPPEPPRHLGDFTLTDRTGKMVTEKELAGKFVIVNFIHTGCSVSCLQVNHQMAEVQRLTAGQDDVCLMSLTVDPRTDTPAVLTEFGNKFGADPNRWLLLTGDKAALYELIETSFLKREPVAKTSPMPGGFLDVDRIAVVDRTGQVRRYYDGMKTDTPAAIAKLLNEWRVEPKSP